MSRFSKELNVKLNDIFHSSYCFDCKMLRPKRMENKMGREKSPPYFKFIFIKIPTRLYCIYCRGKTTHETMFMNNRISPRQLKISIIKLKHATRVALWSTSHRVHRNLRLFLVLLLFSFPLICYPLRPLFMFILFFLYSNVEA